MDARPLREVGPALLRRAARRAWARVRGVLGYRPQPPWFVDPPVNQAQREVQELLGMDAYHSLVHGRLVRLTGSAGGVYTLWASHVPRGAPSFLPRLFDEQRGIGLCVSLDPQGRAERAWEDEWHGVIQWLRHAERDVVETANPIYSYRRRRAFVPAQAAGQPVGIGGPARRR